MKTRNELIQEIAEHGIDKLDSYLEGENAADLHHHLYNMDYFIIGTYAAKQWLNNYDVFEAIEKVTEYEKNHFGEVNTDLHQPERLLNMLAYVIGEELLNNCPTLQKVWDKKLTATNINKIKKELKQAANNYRD